MISRYLVGLIVVILIACTPKVTETIVEKEVKEESPVFVEDKNPCTTLDELPYSQRDKAETAYVLYKDQVKMKNYEAALPLWKKAYYTAPAANGSIKYQFEDGIAIYKHLYENTKDVTLRSAYVDTIMQIYDKRVECFGEKDYVDGRKAFDYYYYYHEQADEAKTYQLFKNVLDAKKEKVDYFVVNPFTKMLTDKILTKEVSLEEGKKYAAILWDAIEYGTASGKNEEAWNIINSYAPSRLENLEGLKGMYDCAYYEKKYLALLEQSPDDCETINMVVRRLLWGDCDPMSESVKQAKALKEEKCYTPPPPPGPLKQAFNAYNEGKYPEAVELFENFVNSTDDVAKKAKYTLLIAKIYYRDIKNYPKARSWAERSLEHNSSSGEPYMLIGSLYASSGPLCGPGTGFDSQIVTWPAIDMWNKAKSDPLVVDKAKELIRTYSQYMPTKEDVFIRGLKAGDTFKVGCWINRSTKIRTAD